MPATAKTLHLVNHESDKLPSITIALNEDGNKIAKILKSVGWEVQNITIDWNDIYPFWLKAELNGEIIGCIQVSISKPVGWLEFLAVKDGFSHQLHALTVKALLMGGCSTLEKHGSTLVGSTVSFERKSFKNILKRRGCVVIGSGNVFLRRLK